ncbi:MAG: 5'-deoxynucleotidase [Huintestinicola sp.]
MEESKFFAIISRMKYIRRWGLMHNTINENISEHSLETAYIAHVLALYRNVRFGGNVDPERTALLAMFHDTTEILTGDLPTPVKYFNPEIRRQYEFVEQMAQDKMLSYLPADLREYYAPLLGKTEEEEELWTLVKAADKLSALIKCVEERRTGNCDFFDAEQATLQSIHEMALPEAEEFLREFMPAYTSTLDSQTGSNCRCQSLLD